MKKFFRDLFGITRQEAFRAAVITTFDSGFEELAQAIGRHATETALAAETQHSELKALGTAVNSAAIAADRQTKMQARHFGQPVPE